MKNQRHLRGQGYAPGFVAASLLIAIAFLTLGSLWFSATTHSWVELWQDKYLRHVIAFSLWQALLSTLFSVLPAVLLARALDRRRFLGRQLLLRLFAMTLVLPAIIVVSGLLTVYGRTGWLAQLFAFLQVPYHFSPYGLKGILLAHVFFNLPLATRIFLQAFENIPGEQHQLAAQLGMSSANFFRLVQWPWLRRQILPVGTLIFILCFSSFAIVLTLGGGPKATTIELAIFQALNYDYNPGRAAYLAFVQITFCLGFLLISQRVSKVIPVGGTNFTGWRFSQPHWASRLIDSCLISMSLLLLLPPLLALIFEGIHQGTMSALRQPKLWQATWTSLYIALLGGALAILLTLMLLWSSRELYRRQHRMTGKMIEMTGLLILAMPGIVLASGFFILFNNIFDVSVSPSSLVIFANALMAIPYSMSILAGPMYNITERYHHLCLSLDIRGWQRLILIEIKALKRPLSQALAFACVISMGDFGVVALFGHDDFYTLPFWLYQQAGAYRHADSAVTALLLFILCFLLFTLIEKRKLAGANT